MTDASELALLVQKRLLERQNDRHEGRMEAILELRANSEKAYVEMCGKNEKRNAEADALAKVQAREFADLLAAGKNPYQVFRQREIAARASAKVAAQERKIKEAEMKIAQNMIAEAARIQNQGEVEKKHLEYVEKYQKTLGRKAVEEKTREYMVSRTGTELVDPTGRTFRIDPSQVTTMKDYSFGLGKSHVKTREQREKVIDMIASKPEHAQVQVNPRWIPKAKHKKTSTSTSTVSSESLLLPLISSPPGEELQQLNMENVALPPIKAGNNQRDVPSRDENIKKGFGVPKRSKLEEDMRQRALVKQKENLIEKQIVWRKEFTGLAFLADPTLVWFKDFDLGKTQTLSFTLTNVSNTFNNFKLLPLPDDIRDFFDIKYDKPGRMSAGMTCRLFVSFCPRLNIDIETQIPAVAKTGYFSIPLRCTTKRIVPELSTTRIDYNNVVVGESSKQTITLRNEGALAVSFRVVSSNSPLTCTQEALNDKAEKTSAKVWETEQELLTFATGFGQFQGDTNVEAITATTEGHVAAYDSCPIHFVFAPYKPMAPFIQTFQVTFDDTPEVTPLEINVHAHAVEVSLYVETPIMDFKCCVYDKLYRNKLVLRNRGKIPLKCQLKVPKYLHGVLEFLPTFGYVQGVSEKEIGRFEIQVKFRPTEAIWKKVLKHRFGIADSGVVAIPLQVLVPDQVLPVFFVLRAQLTHGDLSFSSTNLAFGSCYTTQSATSLLTITNDSRLPQKFGFLRLPPEIRVEPNDGFGLLLPFQSTEVTVIYSPISATLFKTSLNCSTSMNRSYQLPCTGQGILPALRFSETVVTMGAIPIEQFVTHCITCSNTTAIDQTLEIELPPQVAKVLRIRPLVACVVGYGSIRIEIEFRPTSWVDMDEANTQLLHYNKSRIGILPALQLDNSHDEVTKTRRRKQSTLSWQHSLSEEPQSAHAKFDLVCFAQDGNSKGRSALHSLRINVSVIKRELFVKPEKLVFGQVAVGQSSVIKLLVTNQGPDDLELHMLGLHCLGPFSVINALRSVPGDGGTTNLYVEFTPSAAFIYQQDLNIQTTRGDIRVPLEGEGVSPVLRITPADGTISFKPVLARERGFTEFSLLNSSQFPLKFIIKALEHMHPNYNHINVFSCIPSEAIIPPGETQVIRAVFSPDHERPMEYRTDFRIDVPNQTEDHVISLRGRCWECQTYVISDDTTPSAEDIYELPMHVSLPSSIMEFIKKPPRILQVVFDTEAETKHVIVGSIGPQEDKEHGHGSNSSGFSDGKASSPASFEIVFEILSGMNMMEKHRKYFSIEPMKGNVSPGHEVNVAVHFNPKIDDHDNAGSQLRILHWIRITAKIVIKGGYTPVLIPEQVVQVVLKARVLT
ncbi:hypothetical protein THRCLA_00440 [Thraustotheca clavata]|uniref:MSP domain-containing protein n=1 Tax=Thraustotheca clavata TaxID=74557 RepID=A0A1W0AB82_9STRA|nr:hypothetical protein THRCLA_00440 [Thraustotheca clavata]